MSDPTEGGKRGSLSYIPELRSKLIPMMHKEHPKLNKAVDKITDNPRTYKAKADNTRAAPSPRIPTTSEKLRETLAHKDEPKSSVARGSRQVAANKLADKIMKERRGEK